MNTPGTINQMKRLAGLIFVLVLLVSFTMTSAQQPAEFGSFIVMGTDVEAMSHLVSEYGGQVTTKLELINGVGASLPVTALPKLRAEGEVNSIVPNSLVWTTGNDFEGNPAPASDYPDLVGADVVWEAGITGEGVTVAIVDTGLSNHPGLLKKVNGVRFNRIAAWVDFVEESNSPIDPHGHGTHIAGIIANGQQGPDEEWNGVAPGVRLVGVRVLDENGYSDYAKVIDGIQWVIDHKDEYNIQVMNLSIVSKAEAPYFADPLNLAVMEAWANGITVVVAAGNKGSGPMTIGVPGNNPYVITVGAFTDNYSPDDWDDDYLTPFSAAGPTLDAFTKPDVLAPGAHMVSTMEKHSTLEIGHPESQLPHKYFTMAGTSQSAAVVSGVAALTLAANPDLTPDEVKYRIMFTALPWVDLESEEALYSVWQQGSGRVNAPDAVLADISGSANYGMDIFADLAGQHYMGYTYYDEESGEFRLDGEYSEWAGGYGAWAGDYHTSFPAGYGAWAGGYGAYGAWAGGYGAWAGGFGAWAGHDGAWAGSFPDQGVASVSRFSGEDSEAIPWTGEWVDFDG
jgi:serine protease AprX